MYKQNVSFLLGDAPLPSYDQPLAPLDPQGAAQTPYDPFMFGKEGEPGVGPAITQGKTWKKKT